MVTSTNENKIVDENLASSEEYRKIWEESQLAKAADVLEGAQRAGNDLLADSLKKAIESARPARTRGWKEILQDWCDTSRGKSEYSFSKWNSRKIHSGSYVRRLETEELVIGVGVDVSGSMWANKTILGDFVRTLENFLEEFGKYRLVFFEWGDNPETIRASRKEYDQDNPFEVKDLLWSGHRGGTESPYILQALAAEPDLRGWILYTDGALTSKMPKSFVTTDNILFVLSGTVPIEDVNRWFAQQGVDYGDRIVLDRKDHKQMGVGD